MRGQAERRAYAKSKITEFLALSHDCTWLHLVELGGHVAVHRLRKEKEELKLEENARNGKEGAC